MKRIALACETCESREHSLFSCCRQVELETLTDNKATSQFKKGQVIYFEGNKPLGLFCVNQGAIKLYKTGPDGKEQILRIAQAGDFLGYHALIAQEAYHATAEALEDSVACFIPKEVFMEMLDRQPELSRMMLRTLAHDLAIADEQLLNMAQKSVRERMAETLLLLFDTLSKRPHSKQTADSNVIPVQLPREDIANLAGTSTETAIRFLSEFKEDGLIDLQGKQIRILKPEALRKVARANA